MLSWRMSREGVRLDFPFFLDSHGFLSCTLLTPSRCSPQNHRWSFTFPRPTPLASSCRLRELGRFSSLHSHEVKRLDRIPSRPLPEFFQSRALFFSPPQPRSPPSIIPHFAHRRRIGPLFANVPFPFFLLRYNDNYRATLPFFSPILSAA